MLRRTLHVTQM